MADGGRQVMGKDKACSSSEQKKSLRDNSIVKSEKEHDLVDSGLDSEEERQSGSSKVVLEMETDGCSAKQKRAENAVKSSRGEDSTDSEQDSLQKKSAGCLLSACGSRDNVLVSREEKHYLDSCREMVEVDQKIKKAEQKKRKIEESLDEVNGELISMKRQYKELEKKNGRLKVACVRKLNYSPRKSTVKTAAKSHLKPRSSAKDDNDFDTSDNDLVKAYLKFEEQKGK